jgi:translation initiation factor IF-2
MPLTLIGLSDVPSANDVLYVPSTEKRKKRRSEGPASPCATSSPSSSGQSASEEILSNIDQAMMKHFPIILKADVQGSLEAVHQILETIQSDEVCLDIIREGVGPITETDIQMAQTSGAKIYGFSVFPTSVAKRMAEEKKVTVKSFGVIYELVEEVRLEMSELLDPEIKRTDLGKLKVLAIFKNMKKGMVVGGKVSSGELIKGENLEVVRDKEVLGQGKLVQLQHNKEDVSKVKSGLECGITFDGKVKIQVGDTLVCYKEEALKRRI